MGAIGEFWVDQVSLDDPAGRWAVTSSTELPAVPASATEDVKLPGTPGVALLTPTDFETGGQTIGLLVTGLDEAGLEGGHAQLRNNVAELLRLARPYGRLPTLKHQVDARTRQAVARLAAAVDPQLHDETTATLLLPFELPEVFWRSAAASVQSGSGTAVELVFQDEHASAPVFDPRIIIKGPTSSIKVADLGGDSTLEWAGTLPSNTYLHIHPRVWRAFTSLSSDPATGTVLANVSGGLKIGGHRFALTPHTGLSGWRWAASIQSALSTSSSIYLEGAYLQ